MALKIRRLLLMKLKKDRRKRSIFKRLSTNPYFENILKRMTNKPIIYTYKGRKLPVRKKINYTAGGRPLVSN